MQGHLPKFQCETISWSNWTMQNYTWRFSTEWSLSSNGINRHLKGQRVTFRRVPKAAQRQCSKFRQEAGSNPCNWVIYTCQMKNHVIWWNIFSFHGVCPLLDTIHSNHALDMYNGFSPIHLRGSVFTFSLFSVHRHTVRSVTLQYYFWPTDVWGMWQGGL